MELWEGNVVDSPHKCPVIPHDIIMHETPGVPFINLV